MNDTKNRWRKFITLALVVILVVMAMIVVPVMVVVMSMALGFLVFKPKAHS